MVQRLKSVEIARTALFASILTVVDVLTYRFTWPGLPPIIIVPFITSFVLAMSLPFTKNQWIMGLVASLVTIALTGGFLCGPYILPLYGFAFQTGRVKFSGAFSSVVHLFYGVFLAPIVFLVAPAKIVYNWLLAYFGVVALAITVATVIFIIGGVIAAAAGYRIALGVARNLNESQ